MVVINYHRRYTVCQAQFQELREAALKVVEEMERIHDNDPYPLKYRAPFGAIAELSKVLNKSIGLRKEHAAPAPGKGGE